MNDLSLMELAAMISRSRLHIGTSSAPMHIAVAFDVPTFTVYSPHTNPVSWGPDSDKHRFIQGELDKLEARDIWNKIDDFVSELEHE